jgi:hypothetical protein
MPAFDKSFNFSCDVGDALQGSGKTGTFGYLLAYSSSGMTLSNDIQVANPARGQAGVTVATGATISCCGLIQKFRFDGDADGPIRISCYVSRANAANMRAVLSRSLTSSSVRFRPYILNYEASSWYEAVWTQNHDQAAGNLDTKNGAIQAEIASKRVTIGSLADAAFHQYDFRAIPGAGTQTTFHLATSPTSKFVKLWGGDDD